MKIPRKTAILLASAWLATVCLAFWLGHRVMRTQWEELFSDGREALPEQDNQAMERAVVIRKFGGSLPRKKGRKSSAPQIRNALSGVLLETDPIARKYSLEIILSGLALGDIGEAVTLLETLPPGVARDEMLEALLRRWGELDGRSALVYALNHADFWRREAAVSAALAGWSRNEPESAWKWAVENPGNGPFQSNRLNAIIQTMAGDDPRKAFSHALSIQNEALQTGALNTLIDQMFAANTFRGALSWFTDLPEGSSKELALGHIARLWSRYEPSAAADWALRNTGESVRGEALAGVASTWAESDPQKAAAWVLGLPAGEARMKSVTAIVDTWLRNGNTTAAAEWLNRQPTQPDFDRAVRQVALTTMHDDPGTAMTWAESITDKELREATITMVAGRWMGRDPEGATAWLKASGLPVPGEPVLLGEPGSGIFRARAIEQGGEHPSLQLVEEESQNTAPEAGEEEEAGEPDLPETDLENP